MTPPDYGVREEYIPYFIEMGSGIEHYPFFMSQTEVTQREYGYILEAWPFATFNPGSAEKPAENISWYDAILYCNALSIKQGLEPVYSFSGPPVYETSEQLNCIALDGLNCDWSKNGYRLPTAKEWQFAYLAGQKPDLNNGYFFTEGELSDYAWTNVSELHSVARKRPNRWGLFDMAGNVREWVWDDRTHIACGLGGNYQGDHVDVYASACANKKGYWPFVGFRVVRNAPLPPDFTVFANKTEISAGESIEFSAMQTVNSGPVISYYWLFGDGYAGAGRTTKYKFQTSGEYTVKCIAKGEYPRATTTVAVNTKIKVGNTIKLINRDWLSINKFEYFDGITWNTVGANDSRIKYVGAYWGSGECSNSRTGWEDEVETGPSTVEFSFFGSGIRIYTGSQQYQKADVFINGAFISTIVPSEDDCNNLSFEKTGL